jgi:hypothetical protein
MVTIINSESPQTNRRRQEWENQRAVVGHYEQQLQELKSKQQSLFRSLSRGFNGNIKHTVAHVTAITQACQDIETVEHLIRDQSNHTKAKRYDYLASLIEDDERVLIQAQEEHRGAYHRLANINPLEIKGIQTEQALIRLSNERINLLQKDIETRAHEMNELAAAAQRFREGSECVSEGTMVSGGKGKNKVKEQSPASMVGSATPKHLLFPSVPAAILQESPLYIIEDGDESSLDDGGKLGFS